MPTLPAAGPGPEIGCQQGPSGGRRRLCRTKASGQPASATVATRTAKAAHKAAEGKAPGKDQVPGDITTRAANRHGPGNGRSTPGPTRRSSRRGLEALGRAHSPTVCPPIPIRRTPGGRRPRHRHPLLGIQSHRIRSAETDLPWGMPSRAERQACPRQDRFAMCPDAPQASGQCHADTAAAAAAAACTPGGWTAVSSPSDLLDFACEPCPAPGGSRP